MLMNPINAKLFVAIASLTMLCNADSSAQRKKLGEAEAVRLAEQFIVRNGYTDLPPDKNRLHYETIEWASNIQEMLKMRHDTLERHAYGVARGRKGSSLGWTIVFRYKHATDQEMREVGRAVTMNLDGSKIRVEHVDFNLKRIGRRL